MNNLSKDGFINMDFYSGVFLGAIISATLIAFYEYFSKLTDEFYLDPESADRISKVVEENPMCLSDCADILEAVAPLCSMWTTGGFLRRFRIEFPHGTFEETFPDCPSCGNWIDGDCPFKNECTVTVDLDGFRVGTPSKHNGGNCE